MSSGALSESGGGIPGLLRKGLGCLRTMLQNFMQQERPAGAPEPHADLHVYWVTSKLGVGAAPMSCRQLGALREMQVSCILNLCAELPKLAELEREYGFDTFFLAVVDEEAPPLEALEEALAWVDECLYLGKRVYIHCRHGIGRTGTVLNAYLLRRGLGHRLAARTLRGLRAKPTNFDQWRLVRRYGSVNAPLTVRSPSLEFTGGVDLAPYMEDFLLLEAEVEQLAVQNRGELPRCGKDHARCCNSPVAMTLIEALTLGTRINTALTSDKRKEVIERAVAASRAESSLRADYGSSDFPDQQDPCLTATLLCPLSLDGECMLYEYRPLKCRLFDLPADEAFRLWAEVLSGPLGRLSKHVFVALAGEFPVRELPRFPLPDVVSGRYVQTVFHCLLQNASADCLLPEDAPAEVKGNGEPDG
ncbi:protein-tyrosine phosphatase family protein [Oleidesulfovibrio sp.]|uniref:protein-tyrosine phosphatase family protein n=1 Tax=Oleidesulfovibrio sp. TaxID=2909707 RepID=UPI003A8548F3